MNSLFITVLIYGQLSWGPILPDVVEYRQTKPVAFPLEEVPGYIDCIVAVPYFLRHMIGQEVFFYSEGEVYGPWMIVDSQQKKHAGNLERAGLAGDVYCFDRPHDRHVHSGGILFMLVEFY